MNGRGARSLRWRSVLVKLVISPPRTVHWQQRASGLTFSSWSCVFLLVRQLFNERRKFLLPCVGIFRKLCFGCCSCASGGQLNIEKSSVCVMDVNFASGCLFSGPFRHTGETWWHYIHWAKRAKSAGKLMDHLHCLFTQDLFQQESNNEPQFPISARQNWCGCLQQTFLHFSQNFVLVFFVCPNTMVT